MLTRPVALRRALALLVISAPLAACGAGSVGAPPPSDAAVAEASPRASAPLADPASERIGAIALGADVAAVERELGPPTSKAEPVEWAATGMFEASWVWADKGVTLSMGAPTAKGAPTVSSIRIAAPSQLRTSRGVGVGSTRAEVEAAYREHLGKGRQPEEPDTTSPTSLIVGSVYGGTFFTFADGVVTEIFVGAGAE